MSIKSVLSLNETLLGTISLISEAIKSFPSTLATTLSFVSSSKEEHENNPINNVIDKNLINKKGIKVKGNKKDTTTVWFYYYFKNRDITQFLTRQGAGRYKLSKASLNKLLCAFPKVKEQKIIANTLTDIDTLITNLETLITKKKSIKQGTMQQLLTGKKRLQGFTEEWEVKKLGAIGNTLSGLSGKSKKDFDNGNHPYITFLNVMNNIKIDTSIFEYVKIYKGETQNSFRKGDLFFNTSSETPEEVGMCAVLMNEVDNLHLNSFCFGFRLSESAKTDSLLLSYLINSSVGRKLFLSLGQGATRYNLSKSNFNKVEVYIPKDINEQQAIAQILSDMDLEIEALETQKNKTQHLKQGMMQELLTGKTRLVKPANKTTKKENKIVSIAAEPQPNYKTENARNEHFNDAVLIGTMAKEFGSEKYPLTRFMYTKVSYLFKRYKEEQDKGYLKKVAGPYKPKTRYGGAEKIALGSKYVKPHISIHKGKKHEHFLAGDEYQVAVDYFVKWYGSDALQWISQFKYTKRKQLEVLATVDLAIQDLKLKNKASSLENVKALIHNEKEWRPKLKREEFSDDNMEKAMKTLTKLFST